MNEHGFSSPFINKLDSFAGVYENDRATYKGILSKIVYFMAVIGLGIGAFFLLHSHLAANGAVVAQDFGNGFMVYQTEMIAVVISIIAMLVSALVNAFAPAAIPLFGTVYSAATGYAITFVSRSYAHAYSGIVIEALVLTVLLVAVMAFLYFSGIVRVTSKMRMIVTSAFLTMFGASVIYFIMAMVAPNSAIVKSIAAINNGPLGIVFSFIGVAIACFFLIFDFDRIVGIVDNGLERKYEWYAAYGVAVDVIYLYLKILELLAKLQRNRN